MLPFVAALYHTTELPPAADAVAVNVWMVGMAHSVIFPPLAGSMGAAVMVPEIFCVQLLASLIVNVCAPANRPLKVPED